MEIRYTNTFLKKLEDIFVESGYVLRYEKGNFKAGYCVVKEKKLVIVNKFFSLEDKINSLFDIIRQAEIETDKLSSKTQKFYEALMQQQING